MKRNILNPVVVMALASFTFTGCASSTEVTDATAMEETTISETATMAGNAVASNENELEVLVIEEKVVVPVATVDVTALAMSNVEEIDEMFDDIDDTEAYDVLALARTSPNLSTFVKLIEQANLVNDLQRVDQVTLFAPTNEAFARMPQDKLKALVTAESPAALSRMLQAHIVASDVASTQLTTNTRIRVTEDSYIPVETAAAGTSITVGGANLVKNDVKASNGRIHVIDSVILPSENIVSE